MILKTIYNLWFWRREIIYDLEQNKYLMILKTKTINVMIFNTRYNLWFLRQEFYEFEDKK